MSDEVIQEFRFEACIHFTVNSQRIRGLLTRVAAVALALLPKYALVTCIAVSFTRRPVSLLGDLHARATYVHELI